MDIVLSRHVTIIPYYTPLLAEIKASAFTHIRLWYHCCTDAQSEGNNGKLQTKYRGGGRSGVVFSTQIPLMYFHNFTSKRLFTIWFNWVKLILSIPMVPYHSTTPKGLPLVDITCHHLRERVKETEHWEFTNLTKLKLGEYAQFDKVGNYLSSRVPERT